MIIQGIDSKCDVMHDTIHYFLILEIKCSLLSFEMNH
jgi:hypothetical protein